jgi:hypothetical protein
MADRKLVDYGQLVGGHKAVILGESHHSTPAYQDEVARSLNELRRLGFTHFGLEMLQTDVNIGNDKTTVEHINNTFFPGHARIYQEAKRSGFTVVPLDMPISKQQSYGSNDLDRRYADRNHWMLKSAMKYLGAQHKMVLFMHHGHALGSRSSIRTPDKGGLRSLLQAKGISTIYIQIAGGAWTDSICSLRGYTTSNLAQRDNVQNTRFATTGGAGVDHIIHLPQNCTVR